MTRTFSLSADSEKLRFPGRRSDRSIVPNVSLSIAYFDGRNHFLLSENQRSSFRSRDVRIVSTGYEVVTTKSLLQFVKVTHTKSTWLFLKTYSAYCLDILLNIPKNVLSTFFFKYRFSLNYVTSDYLLLYLNLSVS